MCGFIFQKVETVQNLIIIMHIIIIISNIFSSCKIISKTVHNESDFNMINSNCEVLFVLAKISIKLLLKKLKENIEIFKMFIMAHKIGHVLFV